MTLNALKKLYVVAGALSVIKHELGVPRKIIREAVVVGLPIWDPPEEKSPSPPDQATVDRARATIRNSTEDERRAFRRIMEGARKIKHGEPRQEPAGRPPTPPPPGPRPKQGVTQQPPGSS